MKISSFIASASAAVAITVAMVSCGSDKNAQALAAQAERLSGVLSEAAAANPGFLKSASASYDETAFTVDVSLADTLIDIKQVTPALFQYFTAIEVKANADKNLEETVNALSAKDQPMIVKVTDYSGATTDYELSASTLRRLYKTPLTQLDFTNVKNNVLEIMKSEADEFMIAGSTAVSFSFAGGYGDYTVSFPTKKDFITKDTASALTLSNLKARGIKVLAARYDSLGDYRDAFMEMYKSLGIDGFHLIYVTEKGDDTMKITILWRDII